MDRRSPFQRFLGELRRRHVPQTAAVYLVAAWAAIQFADVVAPNLNWPQWVVTAVIVAAGVGLPVVLVLAWVFDWGPQGLHRTEPEAATPGGPSTSSPWLIAVAVLVVGIGSALGVAMLIGDGTDPGAAPVEDAVTGAVEEERDDEDPPRPFPGIPPSIVSPEFTDSLWRTVADTIRRALGQGGLDSLMAAGRDWGSRNLADSPVEILEPDTWRFGTVTPMSPGDTVEVSGIARDSSGVVAVEVEGRVVAEADPPRASLPFETRVVAPRGMGTHTVVVTVRTRAGERRRALMIALLPEP